MAFAMKYLLKMRFKSFRNHHTAEAHGCKEAVDQAERKSWRIHFVCPLTGTNEVHIIMLESDAPGVFASALVFTHIS